MIWFVIAPDKADQSPKGKLTNLLVGSADQLVDQLKRYKEAGLTMPLLWPPFAGVPTAKTLADMRTMREEILPKV